MGPAIGASVIAQTFNCTGPLEFCTVKFDASYAPGNVANTAIVVLSNANRVVVGHIPAGAGRHTISILECLESTVVQFILNNAAAPGGILLIDNVSCECTLNDESDIEPGSQGDIPEDLPPSEELPDRNDPDCNNNDNPDILDILEGSSQDQNNDGIPDECAVPTVSEWGLIGMGVLSVVLGAVLFRRRRAPAAGSSDGSV